MEGNRETNSLFQDSKIMGVPVAGGWVPPAPHELWLWLDRKSSAAKKFWQSCQLIACFSSNTSTSQVTLPQPTCLDRPFESSRILYFFSIHFPTNTIGHQQQHRRSKQCYDDNGSHTTTYLAPRPRLARLDSRPDESTTGDKYLLPHHPYIPRK